MIRFLRLFGRRSSAEPQIRRAHVYRRANKYFIAASSKTRDGFWLEDGPAWTVSIGDSAGLAEAVCAALAKSRTGIAAPRDMSSWIAPVVQAAGLKRFSAFAKGAALVSIKLEAGRLRITPNRNGGSEEGYVGLEDQALEIAQDSPDFGHSIEQAFDRCS